MKLTTTNMRIHSAEVTSHPSVYMQDKGWCGRWVSIYQTTVQAGRGINSIYWAAAQIELDKQDVVMFQFRTTAEFNKTR